MSETAEPTIGDRIRELRSPCFTTVTDLAAGLRGKLVDELCEWEPFRVATVENAMRTVPRHVFLPGIPVAEAYSHGNVVTHRDSAGVAISSASSAGTVADMLQQLEVRPGHRVLEIGDPSTEWRMLGHLVDKLTTGHLLRAPWPGCVGC